VQNGEVLELTSLDPKQGVILYSMDAVRNQHPEFARRPGQLPAAAWLRQRGWKATELPRTGSLQTAWQELGR